jgi:hypothetical protein
MINDAQICGFFGFYLEGIAGGFLPAPSLVAPNRRADGAATAGRNGPCSRGLEREALEPPDRLSAGR